MSYRKRNGRLCREPWCPPFENREGWGNRASGDAKGGPAPTACKSDTKGLLKRAHIVAGEFRYIGKEADRKWEEGEDISVLEFKSTEYGREKRAVASQEVKNEINRIGIKKCARESGFSRAFVRKLLRGLPVKRNSYDGFVRWLRNQ